MGTLTLASLRRALSRGGPVVHHSDRGVHSIATADSKSLAGADISISMAAVGKPEADGYAGRYMRTIKEAGVNSTELGGYRRRREGLGPNSRRRGRHEADPLLAGRLDPGGVPSTMDQHAATGKCRRCVRTAVPAPRTWDALQGASSVVARLAAGSPISTSTASRTSPTSFSMSACFSGVQGLDGMATSRRVERFGPIAPRIAPVYKDSTNFQDIERRVTVGQCGQWRRDRRGVIVVGADLFVIVTCPRRVATGILPIGTIPPDEGGSATSAPHAQR